MESLKAYDLPVRIFHWVFAFLFVTSFSIAKIIDDESSIYAYHMLSGLLMVFIVFLRVLWGFWGSKTARFSSFKLNPSDLISYFKTFNSKNSKRFLGHNPASSYAAIFMMIIAIGMGFTGLLMSLKINKHFFEEIHELLGNGFFIIVLLHIAGVIIHQLKHKDRIIFSMLNGQKYNIKGEVGIKSNHTIFGFVLVVLIIGMGSYLIRNFDITTGDLKVFGAKLKLGENDNHSQDSQQIVPSESINKDDDDGENHEAENDDEE